MYAKAEQNQTELREQVRLQMKDHQHKTEISIKDQQHPENVAEIISWTKASVKEEMHCKEMQTKEKRLQDLYADVREKQAEVNQLQVQLQMKDQQHQAEVAPKDQQPEPDMKERDDQLQAKSTKLSSQCSLDQIPSQRRSGLQKRLQQCLTSSTQVSHFTHTSASCFFQCMCVPLNPK